MPYDSFLILLPLHTDIIPFVSDNCATQYRCEWVFQFWQNSSCQHNKKVIVYHGVSRQDKGIVDAMSGFSVIEPLRKAVVRENFSYNNASNIYEFLMDWFHKDKKSITFHLESHIQKKAR